MFTSAGKRFLDKCSVLRGDISGDGNTRKISIRGRQRQIVGEKDFVQHIYLQFDFFYFIFILEEKRKEFDGSARRLSCQLLTLIWSVHSRHITDVTRFIHSSTLLVHCLSLVHRFHHWHTCKADVLCLCRDTYVRHVRSRHFPTIPKQIMCLIKHVSY